MELAANNYRVIVFDRPGFGHSDRPRNVIWTPDSQAQLIKRALERPSVSHASSSGTLGVWPLMMTEIFGPRWMPAKFEGFPKDMAVRPSQIRASAAESAFMIPDAFHFRITEHAYCALDFRT